MALGYDAPRQESDALFDKYDTDHGGTIDMSELKGMLKGLKAAVQKHYKADERKQEDLVRVDAIRARAAHARTRGAVSLEMDMNSAGRMSEAWSSWSCGCRSAAAWPSASQAAARTTAAG